MKREIGPNARTRINGLAAEAASRFDSVSLSNLMHDRLPEDDQLRAFVEVAESARNAAKLRRETVKYPRKDEAAVSLRHSAYEADDAVLARHEEAIGEVLAGVLTDLEEWVAERHLTADEAEEMRAEIERYRSRSDGAEESEVNA